MNEFKLIEAAGGARPKVVGIAYSGGKMNLHGWANPVVVDLAGMEIPESIPLLMNHENKTDCRVGMIRAKVNSGILEIEGEIFSESKDAMDIVTQAKAGAAWQLSIGADVRKCESCDEGKNLDVNGKNHEGPFYCVRDSILREVSVVAVGADASTEMKIAASFTLNNLKGEKEMPEEKPVVAASAVTEVKQPEVVVAKSEPVDVTAVASDAANVAVKAERKRIADIQSICAGEFADIEKEAISAGWDLNVTREKVLAAYREQKPAKSVNVIVANHETDAKTLEAALSLRCGISADSLVKTMGEQTVEAGMRDMDISIKELMIECARMEGVTVGRTFDNDTVKAAFSTVSLPGILSNVANKKLQQAYLAQPIIATKLCSTGDLVDFKESDRLRLTDVGDLTPVAADGEIQDGGVTEEKAVNQLETYGKKFCLTRKMIINDDLGAFMQVPVAMGNRAARKIDQLFFSRLLSNPTQADNKALFHANHNNLLTGAESALSKTSLEKAIAAFLDQVDADGQPIAIEPRYLVVPTGLKFTAQELIHGATLIAAGSNNLLRPALNELANENLQVVSSPYLANSAYAGYSTTAWYLFGDPSQTDTFEIGYLKGKRTPTVERGETDFNTLGMWFRVYFDLGVREQSYRGMVKANGAA